MNIKLPDIVLLAFFVLWTITLLVGIFWAFRTEKRLKRFFSGKGAKDLEDNIVMIEENLLKLRTANEEIEKEIALVNQKVRKSIQGVETLRFNPFQDQGSNQSFAVGMINEDGDGLVLSSLYSRERMSVFAKPVKGGKSEYELTDEEKEVLEKAKVR